MSDNHGQRRPWHRMRTGALGLAMLGGVLGCDLDLANPNSPTEEAVVSDLNGIIAVAVGMQGQFAQTIEDYMVPNSLVTDEWGTRTASLASYQSLFTGISIDASFLVVESPWSNSYQTIKSANTVLTGASGPAFDNALGSGIRAIAKLYKAMALGFLVQLFEEVPIQISLAGSIPRERAEVMDTVLALLESARADIGPVQDSLLGGFRSRVEAPGFNTRHTINAMLARFYLMDGQYDAAIEAADRVPLNVLSVLPYVSPQRNPIENLAFQLNGGYVGGLQSFVTQAEAGDQRPGYWLDLVRTPPLGVPPDSLVYFLRKYSTPQESFPVYLPDEMKLIKAEAYARTNRFPQARALVNEVRTQASSALNEPVAALPALPDAALDTEAELLAEIARQRRYELYMQGLRWEDTRRFGTALTTTPTIDFLPIPTRECNSNPQNICD